VHSRSSAILDYIHRPELLQTTKSAFRGEQPSRNAFHNVLHPVSSAVLLLLTATTPALSKYLAWQGARHLLFSLLITFIFEFEEETIMWSWFSGAGAQKRREGPKNAILLLRQQSDMLQKRERHLDNQMNEQDAIARKNLATNKTGMLKRREIVATSYR